MPLLTSPFAGRAAKKADARKEAVLFQGFGWDSHKHEGWWRHVTSRIPDLKQAGCTHLWLPPPSQSVSPQGYMPGQLYNLDASKYGPKGDLKNLVSSAKKAGIVSIADVVINHRCADEQVDGVWNRFRDDVDHKGERIDWGAWAITSNDPAFRGSGNPDTGADYDAAPDLDHANPKLRRALTEWLQWLKSDVGFEGWRLDFVKGYAPEFVHEYISATVGMDTLNIGELWVDVAWHGSELQANQDGARQALCNWIDANKGSCTAFDFPTKGILQEAMKKCQYWRLKDGKGKAPGLIGWWPTQAVTFTDNHDTGSSQQHWPFPGNLMGAGYAYILTHPGMPCIFWEHYFDWGSEMRDTIKKLVEVRRRNKIVSDSKLDIRVAEHDLYLAFVDDRVAVKLGPRLHLGDARPRSADGWSVAVSGPDFCVWERGADSKKK